jgi:hypothetical protein
MAKERMRAAPKGSDEFNAAKSAYNRLHTETSPIQPVEVRGGEATKKYGEMLRSPGGAVGATRRQKAAEIEQKWKSEDQAKSASDAWDTAKATVAANKTNAQQSGGVVGNAAATHSTGQHSAVSAGAAAHTTSLTTSGRQTGVGGEKTAAQPSQTWDEVARQGLDSRFAGAQLSRRGGRVFAGDKELPTATERTRQYAPNAPTRAEMK